MESLEVDENLVHTRWSDNAMVLDLYLRSWYLYLGSWYLYLGSWYLYLGSWYLDFETSKVASSRKGFG